LTDGGTATKAVETLRRLADRQFFLAVGFLRPHLPLVAPRKYWDLYPSETIRLTPYPAPPQDAPPCALYDSSELRSHFGMPKVGPLSDEQARNLVRAYAASTSYMDAQVGRVLDELKRLDLERNTVVVFWGDHGWQLGEHGFWGKHTNYEAPMHAPLVVARGDGLGAGTKSDAFVEFVDVYPTLVELCGLPTAEGLDGRSFAALFVSPDGPGKPAVYGQYVRRMKNFGNVVGRTVRTDRYRYVEWSLPEKNYLARELYDYETDPGETVNLAERPEQAAVVEELSELLRNR
jgi:arylsulfatase A-like enzyme